MHADIKPKNVLIDRDAKGLFCVLSDFGITQVVSDNVLAVKAFQVSTTKGVSVSYACPEMLQTVLMGMPLAQGVQMSAADIYSYGVLLMEMLCRRAPWPKS